MLRHLLVCAGAALLVAGCAKAPDPEPAQAAVDDAPPPALAMAEDENDPNPAQTARERYYGSGAVVGRFTAGSRGASDRQAAASKDQVRQASAAQ